MNANIQSRSIFKRDQYVLWNNEKNLVIKKPSILEMDILYEAIQENIKTVNDLFTCTNKN